MRKTCTIFLLCALFGIATSVPSRTFAQTATSTADTAANTAIQKQIDDNNNQIQQLENEINQYQTQLNLTTAQKNTLQNTIKQLTLQNKQLAAKITVTKNQINTTKLQINQLAGTISDTQASINTENAGLAESLRRSAQVEAQPIAVLFLSEGGIVGLWDDIKALDALKFALNQHVNSLASKEQTLSTTKAAAVQKSTQLTQQQKTLQSQQGSLSATTKAKNDLLVQTKSQESAYQSIIAQKKAQEASFEAALNDLKSQLNIPVDPNQITPAGAGILGWPISGTIKITQYFGNTPFANANSALYRGNGHDGVDIAAPIGTPVHAALSGTVIGTGNTDLVRGCYSFGKWVMIKHTNGISTMYAHLSEIDVSQGQSIGTGDVMGYSGETGYATGPHLHFGVYVSAVTQIIPLGQATKSTTPCSKAVMPVPPTSGYLNPLNYLPTI